MLEDFVKGRIWLMPYPVRYFGTRLDARMTIIRLASGKLLLHSPCAIDSPLRREIRDLGEVAHIVAPGTFHHQHVASAQSAFPEADTSLCPGLERKRRGLRYDRILQDSAPPCWADDLAQVVVRGNSLIAEVAFYHRESATLILVDVLEHVTDGTPNTNWQLALWFKVVVRMWNKARPAPEYQLGWTNRGLARRCLRRILDWPFERVILAHGDLIEREARAVVERAWRELLEA